MLYFLITMLIYKVSLVKNPSKVVGLYKHYKTKELAIGWAEDYDKNIHKEAWENNKLTFNWIPENPSNNGLQSWKYQPNVLGKPYYFLVEEIEVLEN